MRRWHFIFVALLTALLGGYVSNAFALCRSTIQERDTNDNVLVTYTRGQDAGGSLQGAGGIGGLLARTDTNGSTFYHADGAGNITALMDGEENIAARYLYNPFGKLLGQWGPMAAANEMQFSSIPRHSASGLSLYAFRPYDPNLQRWPNQDPIGEWGGINLYRFVGNDPINAVDPLGLALYWVSNKPFPGQEGTYGPYLYQVPNVGGPDLFLPVPPNNGPGDFNDSPIETDDGVLGFAAPGLPIVSKAVGAAGRVIGDTIGDLLDALGLAKPKVKCPTATPRMLNAGANPDRGGLTQAGRALQKHGSRPGSVFPPATGNPAAINQQGQQVLDDILNSQSQFMEPNRYGGNDVYDLDTGRGVRSF